MISRCSQNLTPPLSRPIVMRFPYPLVLRSTATALIRKHAHSEPQLWKYRGHRAAAKGIEILVVLDHACFPGKMMLIPLPRTMLDARATDTVAPCERTSIANLAAASCMRVPIMKPSKGPALVGCMHKAARHLREGRLPLHVAKCEVTSSTQAPLYRRVDEMTVCNFEGASCNPSCGCMHALCHSQQQPSQSAASCLRTIYVNARHLRNDTGAH
ncbi:hypothetical protein GY45DRAFT_944114 [Cubamyces sp. BRFM 1775]|nr:hypothetical protein GY45DRAFT_944114 [Cubamyces sp. BRFM 1775]